MITPRQGGRIALGEDLDLGPVDRERGLADLDLAGEAAHYRVVLEQVGHRLGVDEVVHRDELQVGPRRVRRAEDVAPDAPETVDPDLHSHEASTSLFIWTSRSYGFGACFKPDR
jgi:hypothetical protein